MNIITKKVRLIPAPFVGSILDVQVDDGLLFSIRHASLDPVSDHATIDWGDGNIETFTTISNVEHQYLQPGLYHIKFSDDLSHIAIGGSNAASESCVVYAPMVRGFFSNATRLVLIKPYSFHNCLNLTHVNVTSAKINAINRSAFKNCSNLQGELCFPNVSDIGGGADELPFAGCPSISAIRFAEESKARIMSSDTFNADPTLGTGIKDICKFDL